MSHLPNDGVDGAAPSSSSSSVSSPVPPPSSSSSSSSLHPPRSTPLCNFVDGLLTETAGLLMCYAHWKNGHHLHSSVFDLFFRLNPFQGEFTIFAGLEEVLRFLQTWSLNDEDIQMLSRKFPQFESGFFTWLRGQNLAEVKVYAVREGSVVFPRLPLIRVEGPLGICQLLESTLLVLVNYASLIATNAARHRLAVGPGKTLLEFGLRRAQGPDGAMSASRYSYLGGFQGTSNVKASAVCGIPVGGTHAHSFVVSFYSLADLKVKTLIDSNGQSRDFVTSVLAYRSALKRMHTHEGELAAFIAYAQAFPTGMLGLLDTFDTLESGIWNFICVALALHEFGYRPIGVRLDSGDLAYLSREVRKIFISIGDTYGIDYFSKMTIVASNDLSEKVLYALRGEGAVIRDAPNQEDGEANVTRGEQGHEIDTFGVGTNLVTCAGQPALGCVYNQPRMKVSSDHDKVTIPGGKEAYRLYNSASEPVIDLLVQVGTSAPQPNKRILCRHPFDANRRVYVTPHMVHPLHHLVWDGPVHCHHSNPLEGYPSLAEIREYVATELKRFREDHLRRLNPTPYKIAVSSDLFAFMQDLWLQETPIAEII